uniref:Uncharacterized protein n=1 Tax=Vitis vinifera TaxID=29760 RepID=F6GY76_VITVI
MQFASHEQSPIPPQIATSLLNQGGEDYMPFNGGIATFLHATQPRIVHLEHHSSSLHPHSCHFEKDTIHAIVRKGFIHLYIGFGLRSLKLSKWGQRCW